MCNRSAGVPDVRNAAEPRPCPGRPVPVRTCPLGRGGRHGPALPGFTAPEQGDTTWYAAQDAAYRMARFVQQRVTKESRAAGVP